MPRHPFSAKRLAGLAVLACATALMPSPSLAAASPVSAPRCTTAGLVVWMNTQGDGYAGGVGYTLYLTNQSGHACALSGFPGISAVNLSGRQLGRPASWSGHHRTVTLATGATADVQLQLVDVYNYAPGQHCNPVTAAGLRVYPPSQTASKVIPFPFEACSTSGPVFLSTGPLT